MPAKRSSLSPAASTARQKRKPPVSYKFGGRPPRINEISRWQPPGESGLTIGEALPHLIAEGLTASKAGARVGVFPTTLKDWQRRGMNEIARMVAEDLDEPSETEYPFVAFTWGCMQAEAVFQEEALGEWRKHFRKDWRAVQAFMAKRFRDEWGDTSKVELTGANGGPVRVQTEIPELSDVERMVAEAEMRLMETKRQAIDTQEVAQ